MLSTSEICFGTGMLHSILGALAYGEKLETIAAIYSYKVLNLYIAQACTVLLVFLALGTRKSDLRPNETGYILYVICEYLALILLQLISILYCYRSYIVSNNEFDVFQRKYYISTIVLDQIAFAFILYACIMRIKTIHSEESTGISHRRTEEQVMTKRQKQLAKEKEKEKAESKKSS